MTTETNSEIIEQVVETQDEAPVAKSKMTESLTRTFEFSVSNAQIDAAADKRLRQIAKTAKVAGFRPGHVPMARVKQMYGQQVKWEALNDQVGEEFAKQAIEKKFQIVGAPDVVPVNENSSDTEVGFRATFEVYPEVPEVKLAGVQIEQVQCTVTAADVTRTIDVLRKQRVQYVAADKTAANEDQVTVDFLGKLDGVAFDGGTANNYVLVLGQGRMLPEFEAAIIGLKSTETRTFDLPFPAEYHSKDLAGKTAQFTVTVNAVAAPQLPELNAEFAKSLGVKDGDVEKMQADIQLNLEREIANRAKGITKNNVMDALINSVEFDVPTSMVNEDVAHLQVNAREDLRARGIPVDDNMELPTDIFTDRAMRRVRLGLLIADIVKKNELRATPEQVQAHIESLASAYEDPQGFIKWYMTDKERKAQIETITMEDNVVDWALKGATVVAKEVAFEELMNPQQ